MSVRRWLYGLVLRKRLFSEWLRGLALHCAKNPPRRHLPRLVHRAGEQYVLLRRSAIRAEDYYLLGLHESTQDLAARSAFVGSFARWQWLELFNPEQVRVLIEDKLWLNQRLRQAGVRTTEILGVFGPQDAMGVTGFSAADGDAIAWLLGTGEDVFVKPRFGGKAEGIFLCKPRGDQLIWRGGNGDVPDPVAELEANVHKGYIVERRIAGHPLLAALNPASLNTVRIFTVGRAAPEVHMASLRIGNGDTFIDNVSQGGLSAPIDLQTGRLGRAVLAGADGETRRLQQHPSSGENIEGLVLPHWPEICALVTAAAKALDGVDILAWDVAVTEQGPLVLECNSYWESGGIQLAHQHGLKSGAFSRYLSERGLSSSLGLLNKYTRSGGRSRS